MYESKSGVWRIYYNWLHFILSAAIPLAGYVVAGAFQNSLTLTTDFLLSGPLLLTDSGTIETLINDE